MALGGGAVNQPPRWAQALLRALLEPRDRDTIAGDLLEEYRDRLAHSPAPARAWYIRQVLSFVRGRNLRGLPFAMLPASLVWAAAAALAQFAIVFALPVRAGIPVEWSVFILTAVALAIGGIAAVGSAPFPTPRRRCAGHCLRAKAYAAWVDIRAAVVPLQPPSRRLVPGHCQPNQRAVRLSTAISSASLRLCSAALPLTMACSTQWAI